MLDLINFMCTLIEEKNMYVRLCKVLIFAPYLDHLDNAVSSLFNGAHAAQYSPTFKRLASNTKTVHIFEYVFNINSPNVHICSECLNSSTYSLKGSLLFYTYSPKGPYCFIFTVPRCPYCFIPTAPRGPYCLISTSPRGPYCFIPTAPRGPYCFISTAPRGPYCLISTAPRGPYCLI